MNISDVQFDAYARLDVEKGQTARQMRDRVSTLDALVTRGLATREARQDFLPPRDRFVYRKVPLTDTD